MANKYFQKHKEKLCKEAPESLSEEEKNKRQKRKKRKHQQKLPECRINYYLTHKK